jgi:RNA polymerase sigma-70 factor (ECF subfamily)
MTDVILNEVERLGAFDEAERTFQMTEEAFRAFYEQTARPLWLYLAKVSGDRRLADDLLQESYYRLLRTTATFVSDDHRRHYLFRIATNLVHDQRRRPREERSPYPQREDFAAPADADAAARIARQLDLARAMEQLKPRERSLLWLAYAQGWSHEEIARTLGLKTSSMKALLHRARRRLANLLSGCAGGGR